MIYLQEYEYEYEYEYDVCNGSDLVTYQEAINYPQFSFWNEFYVYEWCFRFSLNYSDASGSLRLNMIPMGR